MRIRDSKDPDGPVLRFHRPRVAGLPARRQGRSVRPGRRPAAAVPGPPVNSSAAAYAHGRVLCGGSLMMGRHCERVRPTG
ncbi:MAG: DUF397 domain-containing protein [Actinomycetota bacterium]